MLRRRFETSDTKPAFASDVLLDDALLTNLLSR